MTSIPGRTLAYFLATLLGGMMFIVFIELVGALSPLGHKSTMPGQIFALAITALVTFCLVGNAFRGLPPLTLGSVMGSGMVLGWLLKPAHATSSAVPQGWVVAACVLAILGGALLGGTLLRRLTSPAPTHPPMTSAPEANPGNVLTSMPARTIDASRTEPEVEA